MTAEAWKDLIESVVTAARGGDPDPLQITVCKIAEMEAEIERLKIPAVSIMKAQRKGS